MANHVDDSKMLWFFAGAAIGATVALLFAPHSGEETRQRLKDEASRGRDKLAERGRDIADRGRDLYDKGRSMADEAADLFDRGKRLTQNT